MKTDETTAAPRPVSEAAANVRTERDATGVAALLSTTLWTLVAALNVAYLGAFVLSAAVRLPFPAEFTYGESIVLASARRVALGESLYPAPVDLPLIVSAYMPLYYLVVGGLMRLLSSDGGYVVGRVVSLTATLIGTALLAWSVHRASGHRGAGLLAAGLFLTQNMTTLLWAPLHRVDPLALGLTLAGLALATVGRTGSSTVPLLGAVITKQTYLAAPLAIALALWPHRRQMFHFSASLVGGLVAVVLVLQVLTDGWFVWYTMVANANPIRLDYFQVQIAAFLRFNTLPLLAAGALFLLRPTPGERLWRWYFFVTLLTLPGIGKVGASSNYWLELSAATSALIGLLAARLATIPSLRGAAARASLAVLLLASFAVTLPGYRAVVGEALTVLPSGGGGSMRAQLDLAPFIAAEPGDLLTDDPSLAVAAGKPILFEFVIFRLLAEQGLWDERPILEAIAARRFDLVALRAPLDAPLGDVEWTAGVRDALTAAYGPAGQSGDHWLYRPVSLRHTLAEVPP